MARGHLDLTHKDKSNIWFYRGTYTFERVQQLTESLQEWVKNAIMNEEDFLFYRWAFKIGMNPKRISHLATLSENFKEAYEMAKEWQEFRLQEETLRKNTDYKMAKDMLCTHHGWKMNQQEDVLKDVMNDFGEYVKLQKEIYDEEQAMK